jgi:acetyltransferase-like isoleucine patch superfamily enzyme
MSVDVRDLRPLLAPALQPLRRADRALGRWRRRVRYFRDGIEGICMELRSTIDCADVLREFGARVGENTVIYGPLHIMNAERDFTSLEIGRDVYLGTNILIDLADRVTIGDYVSIGMRSNLVTSFDVGPGPLKATRPRKQGPISLGAGAYLGTGVTVLHGVTVGEKATVGAHCLIRKDVAAGATWVTPEAAPQ